MYLRKKSAAWRKVPNIFGIEADGHPALWGGGGHEE
jgi:hypothetical protein